MYIYYRSASGGGGGSERAARLVLSPSHKKRGGRESKEGIPPSRQAGEQVSRTTCPVWSRVEWRECSAVQWSGVEWSGVEWSGVDWSGAEQRASRMHRSRTIELLDAPRRWWRCHGARSLSSLFLPLSPLSLLSLALVLVLGLSSLLTVRLHRLRMYSRSRNRPSPLDLTPAESGRAWGQLSLALLGYIVLPLSLSTSPSRISRFLPVSSRIRAR